MMHTNKMILVPHDIGHRDDMSVDVMSALDKEMNSILQNKAVPSDQKIILYNQVLHRYRKATQDQARPFELAITEPAAPLPALEEATTMREKSDTVTSTAEVTPRKDLLYEKTMRIVPKKWHSQAKMLYDYARENPHMDWSDKGEMILKGTKISGTNIVDLISDIARAAPKKQQAIGSELFVKNLLKENVPRDLFVNKSRLALGSENEETFASPSGPDKKAKTPKGTLAAPRWLEFGKV